MPNYKEKNCILCNATFKPTSPKQKYCAECRDEGKRIKDRERDRKRSRLKSNYKEYTRVCPACGKKFKTYYNKKIYCGSTDCDKVRVSVKNKNTHLSRDKEYLIEKGRIYYKNHREEICLKKAEKYRENNHSSLPYIPGKTYKHTLSHVRHYIEERGYKFLSNTYTNCKEKILLECPQGHKWETTFHQFRDNKAVRGNRCVTCYLNSNYISRPEQSIRDYFENNLPNIKVIYNDRSVISPKELDLYFPNHNLAVEVCGLYWHSEEKDTSRNYHYNKMMACFERGIRLITVFEDEIYNKFDLVISRIKQALHEINTRVYARKCSITVVDNKTANKFFEDNHIQGKTPCKVAFGLFYDNELVACSSVGVVTRKHANLGRTLELKRFCSLKDSVVVGGASKLFKQVKNYAEHNGYDNIKSYCDMRYANIFNIIYDKLGFDLLTFTKYTPHYFKNGVRYRNMSLRKTPEERLTGKTEAELRMLEGYGRIWDCGHRTYFMEI